MCLQQLPSELITAIFDYLPQKYLRRASSLSRKLYVAAQDAGLFIHRSIDFDGGDGTPEVIKAVIALVAYAAHKPNGPGLSLNLTCHYATTFQETMRGFLSTLTAALPVLVYLSVSVPEGCSSALYDALCFPAPRLRMLALGDYLGFPRQVVLPTSLFAESARRLREVYVFAHSLDTALQEPVPAFRRVSRANLELYSLGPRLQPACLFPNISALWLVVVEPVNSDTDVAVDPVVDLEDMQLEHLSISPFLLPYVRSKAPLRDLRYVEQIGGSPLSETLWPEDVTHKELHAHFTYGHAMARFSFWSPSGAWTRALWPYCSGWDPNTTLLVNSLAVLGARLVTFTLHRVFLYMFLECKTTLGALAGLVIDYTPYFEGREPCSFPPHGHGVLCPALKTLSLLSLDGKVETDTDAVFSLAEALGLAARADGGAVLQLIGVSFVPHSQREPIRQIFKDVREGLAFDAASSAEHYYRGVGVGSDLDVTGPFFGGAPAADYK